jgi:YebC/PmpR family DNA-binding regulatory protein
MGSMSGHSKWSSIKRKKGALDAKRGKIFTRLIKEITVAARLGGGDPSGNPRLRTAISAARAENMPKENIERAIKKGTGELEGMAYEEVKYEGYGPGGSAVLVETMTDNKNRTVAEIRRVFTRSNGSLVEAGSVSWMFHKKGLIFVNKKMVSEDKLMELALDAGAEDVRSEETTFDVLTAPEDFEKVKSAIKEAGIEIELAEISMVPISTVKLEGKNAEQMLRLMEALEDNEDVQKVYANFDIAEKDMLQLSA